MNEEMIKEEERSRGRPALRVPIRKILKSEMVWLGENFCRHNHTYLEHYSCFISEAPDTAPMKENMGVFDIETTGLKANWSHMIAWCIKPMGCIDIRYDLITSREARDKNDKRVIKSAIEEMKKYDRIVTFYGSGFDIPWTRSRALKHNLFFPEYKDLYHTDVYYMARGKLKIHSNRLGSVCQFLGIPAKNHPMTPELWEKAGAGQKEALDTILTHCKEDVESTEAVFDRLLPHTQVNRRSI